MVAVIFRYAWLFFAALAFAAVWFGISLVHKSGRDVERAEQSVSEAKSETRGAIADRNLAEDGTRRLDSYVEFREATTRAVEKAQEDVSHAEDLAAVDAAYRDAALRLRDDAARARAAARADYDSSLAPD